MPDSAGEAPPQPAPLDRLAFLHIPKTAGTSLTQVLASRWGRVRIVGRWEELRDTPVGGLDDVTLFAGHFFGHQLSHPALAGFPAVTVLRDPLERLRSEYRFARASAAAGRPLTELMLYAARVGFFEYAFAGLSAWGRHAQLFILGKEEGMLPTTVPQADLLDQAKRRLGGMLAVGVTEALGPFVARLFDESGGAVPPPEIPHLLAQDGGGAWEAGLTAAQETALRDVLAPDAALHAHARDLMWRWLDRAPGEGRWPEAAARRARRAAGGAPTAPAPEPRDLVRRLRDMPARVPVLQKLCDAADWTDPRLGLVARELLGLAPRVHPRTWEVVVAALALALSGRLDADASSQGLCLGEGALPLAAPLARRSARLMLGAGAEAIPGVEHRPGLDPIRLDLPEGSVDYVCSVALLGALGGEEEFLSHLRSVRRVLRPDGLYVMTTDLRLARRSLVVPGNTGFAANDLLRLVAAAGLRPEPRLDLRLSDFAENDPRDLPSQRHHDPAQDLSLTMVVREEGGVFLAPLLLVLRPAPPGPLPPPPVVEGLEETLARLEHAFAARVELRGAEWTRLNPWGFWTSPRRAWNALHAGGEATGRPPEEEAMVFATGYQAFGAGGLEVQVVLSPSLDVAAAGPAEVEVVVQEWARDDLSAHRACFRGRVVANAAPGRVGVLRFTVPVQAGCRYAVLGRRISGRPLMAAVDVQVRRTAAVDERHHR